MNVYLFEKNISPLQIQKNQRELESIIQECILMTIRESITTEAIISAYMDESVEQEEEVIIENMEDTEPVQEAAEPEPEQKEKKAEETVPEVVPTIQNLDDNEVITKLSFNDTDSVLNNVNKVEKVDAPKSLERLEDISTSRAISRRLEEEDSDTDDERLQIHTDLVDLSGFDILDEPSGKNMSDEISLDGIEELPPI
jgi:hypothetical protein